MNTFSVTGIIVLTLIVSFLVANKIHTVKMIHKSLVSMFCLLAGFGISSIYASHHVEIPRLSPLPVGWEKERVPLAGTWTFNGRDSIEVPGEWVMQGFDIPKGQRVTYSRHFQLPEGWKGKRIKLRCNGIYSQSYIRINGKDVGSHLGGFTAFELDVTEYVSWKVRENTIEIDVISETLADSTSNASRYAVHPLGGITRDIFLFALSSVNLSSFHVQTDFDETYTDATLKAEIAIANESSVALEKPLQTVFTLYNPAGRQVWKETRVCSSKDTTYAFSVSSPLPWTPETPALYRLTCELKQDGVSLHKTSRRVGFREIEVRGNQLYVNNHPVKLRGVCRHEVDPLRGRSLEGDIWHRDVELFRRANVNYIRTSHYPPDEALLEACDELGMFVEVEAPFCWAHEANVPDSLHDKILVNQHLEMVNRDRSHPSVLMWSMGNESNKYAEYFRKAAQLVHQMDPTRPRIFSQWGPDADNQELEIGNHHYPGPGGPDKYRNSKRPIVFDEYCHLNAYNRLELSADPGLRNMWGELLDRMWTAMYHSPGVLGGAIWAGIDDTFFLPGDRAVGYGTWGPVDGWRREKPEYWNMKKAYSPVRFHLKGNIDKEGKLVFAVENRHNFLNLSDCRIVGYTSDGDSMQIGWNLAARHDSVMYLQLPESVRRQDSIRIDVYAPQGYLIDAYAYALRPEITTVPKAKGKVTLSCHADRWTVCTRSGNYTLNLNNGRLEELPVSLMLLPLNAEGRGIQMLGGGQNFDPYTPTCRNWMAKRIDCLEESAQQVRIQVSGSYEEAEGTWTYTFHANGEVEVAYDFCVKEAVSPRQIGTVFHLPEGYSHLEWQRNGYWSVYPADHIAALSGAADFRNDTIEVCGLAGPSRQPHVAWAYDQTEAGSNMFRSTKENIRKAVLSNPQTSEYVRIISDGKQHVRCWKVEDGFCLLVADYSNAGSDTFLSSHAAVDYRPLKSGERVKGQCRVTVHAVK